MLAISVVLYIQFSGINCPNPSQNCVTITTVSNTFSSFQTETPYTLNCNSPFFPHLHTHPSLW